MILSDKTMMNEDDPAVQEVIGAASLLITSLKLRDEEAAQMMLRRLADKVAALDAAADLCAPGAPPG